MPRCLVVLRTDLDGEELNKMALATVHNSVGARMHPRKVGIPMRTSVKFVSVCAGAPIVALFVGGATAWATPSTSEDSSGPTSTLQSPISGVALSAGGRTVVQLGDAEARTTGPSVALAMNNSTAEAHGIGNFAFAGDDSHAFVSGTFSDARAAFGSTSRVEGGFNNHVYAIPGSTAVVGNGDNRIVAALCGGSVMGAQSNRITTSARATCLGG